MDKINLDEWEEFILVDIEELSKDYICIKLSNEKGRYFKRKAKTVSLKGRIELFKLHNGYEVRIDEKSIVRLRDNGALTLFGSWKREEGEID